MISHKLSRRGATGLALLFSVPVTLGACGGAGSNFETLPSSMSQGGESIAVPGDTTDLINNVVAPVARQIGQTTINFARSHDNPFTYFPEFYESSRTTVMLGIGSGNGEGDVITINFDSSPKNLSANSVLDVDVMDGEASTSTVPGVPVSFSGFRYDLYSPREKYEGKRRWAAEFRSFDSPTGGVEDITETQDSVSQFPKFETPLIAAEDLASQTQAIFSLVVNSAIRDTEPANPQSVTI